MGWLIDAIDLTGNDSAAQAWADVHAESMRPALGERTEAWTVQELRALDALTAYQSTYLLARDSGGAVVGAAVAHLPLRDNLSQAFAELWVLPRRRREGVGTALLDDVQNRVRSAGRNILTVETLGALRPAQTSPDATDPDVTARDAAARDAAARDATARDATAPVDPTEAFARRHGFTLALTSHRNDLDLPPGAADPDGLDVVLAPLDSEVAAAHPATDYHLVNHRGPVAPQWLPGRARLQVVLSVDDPFSALILEEEQWDAGRVAEQQQLIADMGRELVGTFAVHTATGEVAGATDIAVPLDGRTTAFQWDTVVAREHRGHRLGAWLKAENLRQVLLHHPHVRVICTGNAASNAPMLRINQAMGFRPVATTTEWQREL